MTEEDIIALRKRLLDITVKYKLSHLSSTWSALPIIQKIFVCKKQDDLFVLSAGHSGLALYVVLEHFLGVDAEMLLKKHGIHPNRDIENFICTSSGSLGCGLPIAIGHALANPNRNVYCLISDGECAEGSIWESLSFINTEQIKNCRVIVNVNGQSAFQYLNVNYLHQRLKSFLPAITIYESNCPSFPNSYGLTSHYQTITAEDAEKILKKSLQ